MSTQTAATPEAVAGAPSPEAITETYVAPWNETDPARHRLVEVAADGAGEIGLRLALRRPLPGGDWRSKPCSSQRSTLESSGGRL